MGNMKPTKERKTRSDKKFVPEKPKGRAIGRKNKRTEAQEAFKRMGYNPAEVQIALAKELMNQLVTNCYDGRPMTIRERESVFGQLLRVNELLMQYQCPKAQVEIEVEFEEIDEEEEEASRAIEQRPLSDKELLEAKKKMSLQDRLG